MAKSEASKKGHAVVTFLVRFVGAVILMMAAIVGPSARQYAVIELVAVFTFSVGTYWLERFDRVVLRHTLYADAGFVFVGAIALTINGGLLSWLPLVICTVSILLGFVLIGLPYAKPTTGDRAFTVCFATYLSMGTFATVGTVAGTNWVLTIPLSLLGVVYLAASLRRLYS